jgi:uncharacterized protein
VFPRVVVVVQHSPQQRQQHPTRSVNAQKIVSLQLAGKDSLESQCLKDERCFPFRFSDRSNKGYSPYTEDSQWRNRAEFLQGREEIKAFLKRKWAKELDYRLKKELRCFMDNRIAVRFEYEWHDDSGFWYRSYGNKNWEFAENGLMMRRFASINDLPIQESERKFRWERPIAA